MTRRHGIIAPSLVHAGRRVATVLLAAALVTAVAIAVDGWPSPARAILQNERARFAASLRPGVIQFLGEAGLTVLFAWIARRWLRVRLERGISRTSA